MKAGAGAMLLVALISRTAFSQPLNSVETLISSAKTEGELDLVTPLTGGEAELDAWIAGFTELYGYRPNVNVSPTGDMPTVAARIIQERQAGRPSSLDIVIGSEAHLLALARQDALQRPTGRTCQTSSSITRRRTVARSRSSQSFPA